MPPVTVTVMAPRSTAPIMARSWVVPPLTALTVTGLLRSPAAKTTVGVARAMPALALTRETVAPPAGAGSVSCRSITFWSPAFSNSDAGSVTPGRDCPVRTRLAGRLRLPEMSCASACRLRIAPSGRFPGTTMAKSARALPSGGEIPVELR